MQANFKSITREQLHEKFIKEQTRGPPVGTYRMRYQANDKKVTAPLYGTQSNWGGEMAKKAMKIRDETFKNKVHKCERLDKTLVYNRVRNSVPA
mmetsp:Transcript_23037/g.30631  ORF Transcript_23037/g.30631 Transcript_23037/m.30631 type:complete len:94 (+) Transcript_23037:560-841(+)